MAGIISPRILALFVPTFLAFLSAAYWLRRKRKIKELKESLNDSEDHSSTSDVDNTQNDSFWNHTPMSNGKAYSDRREKEHLLSSVQLSDNSSETKISDQMSEESTPVDQSLVETFLDSESKNIENTNETPESSEESYLDHVTCTKHSKNIDEADIPILESSFKKSSWESYQNCEISPKEQISAKSSIESKMSDSSLENDSSLILNAHQSKEVQDEIKSQDVNAQSVTTSSSLNNDIDKDSPAASGSPVSSSSHSTCSNNNFNSNDASDCEVTSSVGTSSISLNELMSVSPVGSTKENSLNFHTLIDEDTFNDSGKGSTINTGPVSSCSFASELDDSVSVKDPIVEQPVCSASDSFTFSSQSVSSTSRLSCSSAQYFPKELGSQASTSQNNCDPSSVQMQFQEQNGNMKMATTEVKMFENSTSSSYVYEFELPQELCGRLIGRLGKHVSYIKESTNAAVYIKRHPFNHRLKLAVVEGTRYEVNNAMELIRKKFPPAYFPNVSLAQTNSVLNAVGVAVPDSLQLHLPDRTSCDVILSSMVSAGHFFLQQPTHPTYSSLSTLDQCMTACYSQGETPRLPSVIESGVICAATVMSGWYRAQVTYVHENEDCELKFVDYGGYSTVPVSSLRQIRSDFMTLPFQASECYLSNVQPTSDLGWTTEASATFEELAQGQILQAMVVDYHDDGIPYVQLYRVQGISSTFINQELVNRGMAKWVDHHR